MHKIPQERLFTDLTPDQAETITAAGSNEVNTSYGRVIGSFVRTGSRSFESTTLWVKDKAKDGDAVYAKFQGRTTDGSVLIPSASYFDRRGAEDFGTNYYGIRGSFSRSISHIRLAIYRQKSGVNPVAVSGWSRI